MMSAEIISQGHALEKLERVYFMKRFLALLLVVVSIFVVAGCGNTDGSDQSDVPAQIIRPEF